MPMKLYQGTPVFPGKAIGPARSITSVKDLVKVMQGDIVICDRATPLYAPAFKKATGIVFEHAGVLAHATTLAREYKIPCVAGIPHATAMILQNTLLSIDGNNGMITCL